MEFHNPTEFTRFISANDLARLDNVFLQLILCINNYSASCNCINRQDKEKTYNVCKALYAESARQMPRFKSAFFSKTSDKDIVLYTETGQVIGSISR